MLLAVLLLACVPPGVAAVVLLSRGVSELPAGSSLGVPGLALWLATSTEAEAETEAASGLFCCCCGCGCCTAPAGSLWLIWGHLAAAGVLDMVWLACFSSRANDSFGLCTWFCVGGVLPKWAPLLLLLLVLLMLLLLLLVLVLLVCCEACTSIPERVSAATRSITFDIEEWTLL